MPTSDALLSRFAAIELVCLLPELVMKLRETASHLLRTERLWQHRGVPPEPVCSCVWHRLLHSSSSATLLGSVRVLG